MSTHSKLEELRARTDRELLRLIAGMLERGLTLASGDPGEAARLCGEAARLLEAVRDPDLPARREAEGKLRELREALDSGWRARSAGSG